MINNDVYELLSVKTLKIAEYQYGRLNPVRAKKIANAWDENRFEPLIVSYRDGIYWVVDGQHRLVAKKIKFGQDVSIMCKILTGLTYEQEAFYFATQDAGEKSVPTILKFNALMLAKDEMAININKIIEDSGFKVAKYNHKSDCTIAAIDAIQYIYNKSNPSILKEVLDLIRDTWYGSSDALDGTFIKGVYSFVKTYYSIGYDHKRFIKAHKNISATKIKRDARDDNTFKDGFTKFGIQMWNHYNNQLRQDNKLPFKFISN
jgi:hypothetical protein